MMRSLGDTVQRLAARRFVMSDTTGGGDGGRLRDLAGFGNNPGALRAYSFVPPTMVPGAPLVVVLHGCTQTAADYDRGSGWSALAEEHGFALIYPEQIRANNANLCFNWFVPGDIAIRGGEVESICQMIAALKRSHGLGDVYVTGLSAGGAMAMALLATQPALFVGGAILAGLPFGTAHTVPEAFDRMRGHGLPDAAGTSALVRTAAPGVTRWPRLSVWQGASDTTVHAANAGAIVDGWARLHGAIESGSERINGHRRRLWRDGAGTAVIERYDIAAMGHGTPIGEDLGIPGPYMLAAGLSSTRRIAVFWGIAPEIATEVAEPSPAPSPALGAGGARAVIETAMRSAGLLR